MSLSQLFRARSTRAVSFVLAALGCGTAAALLIQKYRSPQGFLVDLKSSQIGVRIDAWSGERRLVTTPGYHLLVPGLQEIALFERSPIDIELKGGTAAGGVPIGPTTVRASDGSKFWFEAVALQTQMRPEHALAALDVFGGDRARENELIALVARAALVREYGRLAAHEVADPATTDAKKLECKKRMRESLEPYGVELIQFAMPKARFEREYERAIDERQLAAQALDKTEGELNSLVAARAVRLEKLDRELTLGEKTLAKLAIERRMQAEAAEIERRGKVDAWAVARRADGQAKATELAAVAQARRESALALAAGLRAEVDALASAGDLAVREAIVKRLATIEFTLSPFLEDPAPHAQGSK
jgi:regulator of protease activity HflC (stomatin/prohibitin superfamily)